MKKAETGERILSFLDGDPNYFNAIETFVQSLPERVEDIQAAFDGQALNDLAVKLSSSAQQTAESAGDCLPDDNDPACEVDKIFKEMDSMIQLCLVSQFKQDCPQPDGDL